MKEKTVTIKYDRKLDTEGKVMAEWRHDIPRPEHPTYLKIAESMGLDEKFRFFIEGSFHSKEIVREEQMKYVNEGDLKELYEKGGVPGLREIETNEIRKCCLNSSYIQPYHEEDIQKIEAYLRHANLTLPEQSRYHLPDQDAVHMVSGTVEDSVCGLQDNGPYNKPTHRLNLVIDKRDYHLDNLPIRVDIGEKVELYSINGFTSQDRSIDALVVSPNKFKASLSDRITFNK